MANTYSSLTYHFVFSTKNREPWLVQDIESRVWSYIGGIARAHDMQALQVGGIEDHIHALVIAPATIAPCQIAQYLKGGSSSWIHNEFPQLKLFGWQDGYGAFSVSRSSLPNVIRYIQNQREQHRNQTFQDEYRELLRTHGVDYRRAIRLGLVRKSLTRRRFVVGTSSRPSKAGLKSDRRYASAPSYKLTLIHQISKLRDFGYNRSAFI